MSNKTLYKWNQSNHAPFHVIPPKRMRRYDALDELRQGNRYMLLPLAFVVMVATGLVMGALQ